MIKFAHEAGHGINTAGKRTPDGEREWTFNDKVARAFADKLTQYEGVQLLRLDDPTGKTDVPLKTRTDKANAWGADALFSFHHNAVNGQWHSSGGVETFTHPLSSKTSKDLQKAIHPALVKSMRIRDRGMKTDDFHMLRESKMPAVLIEGGFMDSTLDIVALRDDARLKAQGESIAVAVAQFYGLKEKKTVTVAQSVIKGTFRLKTGTFKTKESAEAAQRILKEKHGWTSYVMEE